MNRWRSRPVLGIVMSGAAVIAPLGASVLVAVAVGRSIPRGTSASQQVLWWAAVLGASTVAFVGSERVSRRLLPLAALLKMTMLFPDQAPKRLRVAWSAGTTRDLERRSHDDHGEHASVPSDTASEILALAASLSRHDRATRGHSERVRAFTDMIADELNLSESDRDRLRWSALLHDVGKLAVHPHILNKAGRPTDEEWQEIRNHPLEGRRLIAPLADWLGNWSLAIEQHHESYDGSGYPFGLSGDELSLGARIVSVADSFEVMTAARSYKKAMSAVVARQELTRCAGTQFDPVIVRAFLNVSLGRLRWVIGPVSWIADVPIVARLGVAGHGLVVGAQVALGASALSVGGLLAAHAVIHTSPAPQGTHDSVLSAAIARGTTPSTEPNLASQRVSAHGRPDRASVRAPGPLDSTPTSSSTPVVGGVAAPSTSSPLGDAPAANPLTDPETTTGAATPSEATTTEPTTGLTTTTLAHGVTTSTTSDSTPVPSTTTTVAHSTTSTSTTKPPTSSTTTAPTTTTTTPPTTTTKPPTTTTTPPTTTTKPPTTTTTTTPLCILGIVCL